MIQVAKKKDELMMESIMKARIKMRREIFNAFMKRACQSVDWSMMGVVEIEQETHQMPQDFKVQAREEKQGKC